MNDGNSPWTQENDELLISMRLGGYSSSQIATKLGNGITRNSVIGRAQRLMQSGRLQRHIVTRRRTAERDAAHFGISPRAARKRAQRRGLKVKPDFSWRKPALEVSTSRLVTIIELEASHCRFPIGDPLTYDFRYCGADRDGERVYCKFHHRLAHTGSAA